MNKNILITGANFNNKGAQLMLVSLVDLLKIHYPNANICVSPIIGNRDKLKSMGVLILDFPLFHYGNKRYFKPALQYPLLIKLIMALKGKNCNGEIKLKHIDCVFDISGFAFGDKWGERPIKDLSFFTSIMHKNKSKFILLPQALGPFTIKNMAKDLQNVVKQVDMIIARDQTSFEYVNDVINKNDKNKLYKYPDITLTFQLKAIIDEPLFSEPFCAIVPNERMLDKASSGWQENYYQVMSNIINLIMEKSSINVIMLIHAGGNSNDGDVGKLINSNVKSQFSDRLFYYIEEDPVRLKTIISKSSFLIGSRFHALASSLSSNVPAIGTSWLHKYEMLFSEYDCSELSFSEPRPDIYTSVLAFLDSKSHQKTVEKLIAANKEITLKKDLMWQNINKIVG